MPTKSREQPRICTVSSTACQMSTRTADQLRCFQEPYLGCTTQAVGCFQEGMLDPDILCLIEARLAGAATVRGPGQCASLDGQSPALLPPAGNTKDSCQHT